jgi:hypothetical protein
MGILGVDTDGLYPERGHPSEIVDSPLRSGDSACRTCDSLVSGIAGMVAWFLIGSDEK